MTASFDGYTEGIFSLQIVQKRQKGITYSSGLMQISVETL